MIGSTVFSRMEVAAGKVGEQMLHIDRRNILKCDLVCIRQVFESLGGPMRCDAGKRVEMHTGQFCSVGVPRILKMLQANPIDPLVESNND